MRPLLAVLLAAASTVFPSRPDAAPVTRRLAVVAIQNGDTGVERARLADTTYLRGVFFGQSDSLAAWMPAVTHGLLSYIPAGDGVFAAEPNAALRNGDRSGCLTDAARTTAEEFLSSRGVSWDALAIVFDIGSCGWTGLGQMPGTITWYPPKPSLSVIVHEIGHNLGYPDETKRDCIGGSMAGCRPGGHSGNTPMGYGGAGRGYSSVELLHSGWVEPGWLVRTGRPGTFTLKQLYAPVSTGGTRVVEFQASATTGYVIESRAATSSGVDSAVAGAVMRVYAVFHQDYRNAWMINPGGSVITDPANRVTITLRSPTTVEIAAVAAPAAQTPPDRSPAAASPSASAAPPPAAASATAGPDADPGSGAPSSPTDNAMPPTVEPRSSSFPLLAIGLAVAAAIVLGAFFVLRPRRRKGRHAAH